jgi:uncharacterized membrane protein YfcA
VIVVSSAVSVLIYAFSGAVLWKLAFAATIFNIAGSYLGARLAIRNGSKVIRPIMIVVVVLLMIKLIFDMAGAQ